MCSKLATLENGTTLEIKIVPRIHIPPCAGGILGRRPYRSQLCRRACAVLGSTPIGGAQDLYPSLGWRSGRNAFALSSHGNLLVHFTISACLKFSDGNMLVHLVTSARLQHSSDKDSHARAQPCNQGTKEHKFTVGCGKVQQIWTGTAQTVLCAPQHVRNLRVSWDELVQLEMSSKN